MTLRSHLWADLTRSEIAAARDAGALVVIPIGATEQHAEHLPVGTDSLTSGRLSLMAAEACDILVLVAPTISVAFSPHHASWPGTLTLSLPTLRALIGDITASIERVGFKRQLLVNGHGGNRAPLSSICLELVAAGRAVGFVDYFAPPAAELNAIMSGGKGGVTHAAEAETSLVMALEKHDADKLAFYRRQAQGLEASAARAQRLGKAPNPVTRAGGWWANLYLDDGPGYNGDPAQGSVEKGDRMIAAITEKLADFFAIYAAAELKTGPSTPSL